MSLPKTTACLGCAFESRGQGFCPGEGPLTARVAWIGQGPGEAEVRTGRPFRSDDIHNGAPSGRKLNQWLHKAQFLSTYRFREAWVDNVVRCRIRAGGQDLTPPAAVAECTRRHWLPTLAKLTQVEVVVTVGTAASQHFLGPWAGSGAAGTMMEIEYDDGQDTQA